MNSADEERILEEDYYARRRDFLARIHEGARQNKADFHKQIMILSVAGLGFNLSPLSRGNNSFDWPLDNAWEVSVAGFLLATLTTLIVFYVQFWHYTFLNKVVAPATRHSKADERFAAGLGTVADIFTILGTASFTFGVVSAIISL